MAGGFTPIDAPPSAGPRVGLLPTLGGVSSEPNLPAGWENGIAFEPERCLPPDRPAWGDCPEPGGDDPREDPGTKDIGTGEAVVQYRPWMAWVGDKCSTLSGQRDPVARARRLYESAESRIMEAELWRGDEATRRAYPNNFLRNSASPHFVNLSPLITDSEPGLYALSALQAEIAAGQTGRGMIHAAWPTVNLWWSLDGLRREGGLLLDAFDNIVVPGSGYDGSAPVGWPGPEVDPTGETQWAYATGLVVTKRQQQTTVVPGADRLAEAVRTATNDEEWRVERIVGAWWDGCVHAAVRVNLCCTFCEPEGS